MERKIKRVTLIIIIMAVMTGITYATEPNLEIIQGSADATKPGSKNARFDFHIKNNDDINFNFESAGMVFDNSQGLTIRPLQSGGTIQPGETKIIAFQIDVSDRANEGTRAFQLQITYNGEALVSDYFYMFIMDSTSELPPPEVSPGAPRTYRPAADFSHTLGGASGFSPGKNNTITFYALNKGDTSIHNTEFTIELPEGMSVFNASTAAYVGTLSIGQKVGRTFSVMVYDDLEGGKAYPITLKVTGTDKGKNAVELERTFHIPVTGTGAGAARDILIENISLPTSVVTDEDFTMTFNVRNTGASTVRNIKAYAQMPEGILNKSNTTFVIDSIGSGETQAFSVTMSAREGSNKSYPIKIAVAPLSGDSDSVVRYASVFARGSGDSAKMPQLMVDQYSYGGSSVMAGKEFFLNLGIYNTSNKRLSNIKVTILSDDGTFVPVDSSNSFFINQVDSGGRFTKTIRLSAKPSAEQKTTAITVKMSYEDGEGEPYTAEDTISIPVMQAMRLSVDEIVPPYECYAGSPGVSALQFYNMGKTTLNNLMINAEGNFDIMESNSYYVGNMEGGKSDSYTFVFIPRDVGPMEGKVVFTYENIDGDPIVYEVPFVFEAMEMPVWDDPYMEMPQGKNIPWKLILFGIVVILAVAGIIVWQKIRKIRLHKKLEIQDAEFYAAMDLDKNRSDQ